jgi:uncharacterized secreted protein with C-terminal beta-propeller domain
LLLSFNIKFEKVWRKPLWQLLVGNYLSRMGKFPPYRIGSDQECPVNRIITNKTIALAALLAALSLLISDQSSAQPGMPERGSGGWGNGTPYNRRYNPKTVETINGEVVSVDSITPMGGMSHGVHLTVKTAKETVSIHLGPTWHLENQNLKINARDRIEVKGSRVSFAGKPVIIAAEVRKAGKVLKLRDNNGLPVWSHWQQRHTVPGNPF